jgi:AraC-like DNA-binding protein
MNDLASSPTDVLRLLGAGLFKMTETAPSQPLSQNVWILEIIAAGELQVSIEGTGWRSLGRGDGVLYAPGTRYREKVATPGRSCRSMCVFFETSTLPAQKAWQRLQAPFLFLRDTEDLLAPLAQEVLQRRGLSAADDLLATACFLEIIAHLLRAPRQEQTLFIEREYSADLTARIHHVMRARLSGPVSLQEIAGEVGLSVSGLAHAYKRATGLSPMAALRQMRVEAAKSHLLRDRLSLAQIADETGFADAFHLSRTFKQNTGVSPRQFRRRVLGSPSRLPKNEFSSRP